MIFYGGFFMRLKRITALFLAVLTCIMVLAVGTSAAEKKNSVKLNKTKITLSVGETETLKAAVAKKCVIQWSSSDKSVAAVKKGGVVTAKKEGTAKITVKIKGTDIKAVCKVTVEKKKASKKGSGTPKSGQELLDKITVGWNLGNTLDSINCSSIKDESKYETGWGNPMTTKAMIDTVKKAGFNTVRIPVSWGEHMDKNGKVSDVWMNRVQEIVDYAYDNDMYIILNTHHDNTWLKLTEADEKETTKKFKYLWKQIAKRFKDYDEKLIFEGRNEPRTEGSAKEWTGGTAPEREVINRMYGAFVDAVRGEGGYNETRYLIVTPYGASSTYEAMADLEIPDDDRIIVSVHAYLPYDMALNRYSNEKALTENGKKEIDKAFSNIDKVFISKGIPVIMDEFASLNKNNTKERIELAEYYISAANKYGIPCVWWDNGTICQPKDGEGLGILNRSTLEWYYPELVKAIVNTAQKR